MNARPLRFGRRAFGLTAAAAGVALLVPRGAVGEDAPAVLTVPIPGDRKVEVVLGPESSGRVIIYLHGVCGDPFAFKSWAAPVAERATLISMRGDEKCDKRKGRFQWSYDFRKIDRRIDKAIAAVDELRRDGAAGGGGSDVAALDATNVVLIGYSQGAHRVAGMAQRYPDRYRRVALVAPAREPNVASFKKSERVLFVGGELDVRKHIKDAHEKLKKAGIETEYLELPGARHGEYGPEAERVMAQGLEWLYKNVP